MKTAADYRRDVLTVVGDVSGRRYAEGVLDMGIREALAVYRRFCPNKTEVRQRILSADGCTLVLAGFPDPDIEILTIRDEAGHRLNYAEYRTGEKVYISIYGSRNIPRAVSLLLLELSVPHSIKGLDGSRETTVPDGHALMICRGAAGYAMRIRARSVTEVFGKRPEDREALMNQAEQLIMEYEKEMERISLNESFREDPWPVR